MNPLKQVLLKWIYITFKGSAVICIEVVEPLELIEYLPICWRVNYFLVFRKRKRKLKKNHKCFLSFISTRRRGGTPDLMVWQSLPVQRWHHHPGGGSHCECWWVLGTLIYLGAFAERRVHSVLFARLWRRLLYWTAL